MNRSSRDHAHTAGIALENGVGWHTSRHDDLPTAIAEFKAALPGWWYSVCECQVSCDATCAPTAESPDIALVQFDNEFDSGFRADLLQPSTLAAALRAVTAQALAAKGAPPSTQQTDA